MISIAIDGPTSSGKTTLSKLLSKKLGFANFDTGSLYRAVALYFLLNEVDETNLEEVKEHLKNIKIDFIFEKTKQKTIVNGKNVTRQLFDEDVSIFASKFSAILEVREFLLETQRNAAKDHNIVMNGRDIGTVVLPNASIKFFITASAEVRANRRYQQLRYKKRNVKYKDILKSLKERDFNDTTRALAPLITAKDAIVINDSTLGLSEVLRVMLGHIKERIPELQL